jgi:hypothetical protein
VLHFVCVCARAHMSTFVKLACLMYVILCTLDVCISSWVKRSAVFRHCTEIPSSEMS